MIGVYAIINIVNKRKYIGGSSDLFSRWEIHLNKLLKNSHDNKYLQEDFNKHSYNNFHFKVIEFCSIKRLSQLEMMYIRLLNDDDYNITGLRDDTDRTDINKHERLFIKKPLPTEYVIKVFNYIMENKNENISPGVGKITRNTGLKSGEVGRIRDVLIKYGYLQPDKQKMQTLVIRDDLNLSDFEGEED